VSINPQAGHGARVAEKQNQVTETGLRFPSPAARLQFVQDLLRGIPICNAAGEIVAYEPLITPEAALELLDLAEMPFDKFDLRGLRSYLGLPNSPVLFPGDE
jgi:hypothetical protein